MKRSMALFSALAALAIVPGAGAATGSLFGGASIQGNQVSLVSNMADTSTANDASGISFSNTGVTTFSSLTELATKFNVTDDGCGAGWPRVQVNFGTTNEVVCRGPS